MIPRGISGRVQSGIIVIIFFAAFSSVFSSSSQAGRIGHVPDQLIVEVDPDVSDQEFERIIGSHGLPPSSVQSRARNEEPGLAIIRVPVDRLDTVKSALSKNPRIQSVSKNYIYTADIVPNDTLYSLQWSLPIIGAPDAWDVTQGSAGVIIAVLDSGVSPSHPDLAAKLVPGYNFFSNNTDTDDVFGHGTEVAGVAGAVTGNAAGVAGLAWQNKIMPVRITNSQGSGYSSTIARGLRWAVKNGARVMNVSFSQIVGDPAIEAAAKYVDANGGIVVAAAGNCGCVDQTSDSAAILSVSATDSQDRSASFSSTGPFVDLSAPGVAMYTTIMSGGYTAVSGTSFSSPLTAALAALLFSIDPSFTPDQVKLILIQTADPIGSPGWNSRTGWGRINASRAVRTAAGLPPGQDISPPSVSITTPGEGEVVQGTVNVSAVAVDDVEIVLVRFLVDGSVTGTSGAAPYQIQWNTLSIVDGAHTLSAEAVDTSGNVGTAVPVGIVVANDGQGDTTGSSAPQKGGSSSGGGGCGVVIPPGDDDSSGPGNAAAMLLSLLLPLIYRTILNVCRIARS